MSRWLLEVVTAHQDVLTQRLNGHPPTSPKSRYILEKLARLFRVKEEVEQGRITGPRILTPEEFDDDLAPSPIVEGLIYENSTHLLSGASKGGKTNFALQLAMAVASGTPFLGMKVDRRDVLYVSLELSAGMLRDRMRRIAEDTRVPYPTIGKGFFVIAPTIAAVPALDLTDPAGQIQLEQQVLLCGAELVVLDTLYRFLPNVDPNSNAEMGKVMGELNEFSGRWGVALLVLDHVAKGEQLGPVSHSPIGAQVKGGAARAVIFLRRTAREDGGRWEVNVESHFGSWDKPIHYERPAGDTERGYGCVLCSASAAYGLDYDTVRDLFREFGVPDDHGRLVISSKKKLTDALIAKKLATGNNDASAVIRAIERDFCTPAGVAAAGSSERPIETSDGPRNARVFTWKRIEEHRTDGP